MTYSPSTALQALAVIGVVLVIAEIFLPGFIALPLGIAFLLAAPFSYLMPGWAPLLAVLCAIEIAVFVVFTRYLRPYLGRTKAYTGAEGMIGREVTVTEEIPPGGTGYVKLYGDRWQARHNGTYTLRVGERANIVRMDGNKVIVESIDGREH